LDEIATKENATIYNDSQTENTTTQKTQTNNTIALDEIEIATIYNDSQTENTTTENQESAIQTQEGDRSQEQIDETDAFSSSISGRIDHILNELKITQRLGKKNNDNKQKKNVSEVITCTKYFAVYFLNLFIL